MKTRFFVFLAILSCFVISCGGSGDSSSSSSDVCTSNADCQLGKVCKAGRCVAPGSSEDDFRHDFGDVEEDGVKSALYYFEKKKCPENPVLRTLQKRKSIEELIPGELKGMGKIDYTF